MISQPIVVGTCWYMLVHVGTCSISPQFLNRPIKTMTERWFQFISPGFRKGYIMVYWPINMQRYTNKSTDLQVCSFSKNTETGWIFPLKLRRSFVKKLKLLSWIHLCVVSLQPGHGGIPCSCWVKNPPAAEKSGYTWHMGSSNHVVWFRTPHMLIGYALHVLTLYLPLVPLVAENRFQDILVWSGCHFNPP